MTLLPITRFLFLGLAIWGAIHPMWHFLPWLFQHGFDVNGLIEAWKVSSATTGLYWDLVIAAIALTLWIVIDVLAHKNWKGLLAIPAIYLIGVSCGLPLYIYLRWPRPEIVSNTPE